MLREEYWFPLMNSMIDTAIDQCYEFQVATKRDREEPIKVTSIPTRPWDTISIDHWGPSPDGHYNLVLIDKRTRYPVLREEMRFNRCLSPTDPHRTQLRESHLMMHLRGRQ